MATGQHALQAFDAGEETTDLCRDHETHIQCFFFCPPFPFKEKKCLRQQHPWQNGRPVNTRYEICQR